MKKIVNINIEQTKLNITYYFSGKIIVNNKDFFVGTLHDISNNHIIVGYMNHKEINLFDFCNEYYNKNLNLIATTRGNYYIGNVFDASHNRLDITCKITLNDLKLNNYKEEYNEIINNIEKSEKRYRLDKLVIDRYQQHTKMHVQSSFNESSINYIKRIIKK